MILHMGLLLEKNIFLFETAVPVPEALSLAWHAEAIPVVGEVAVNKHDYEKYY